MTKFIIGGSLLFFVSCSTPSEKRISSLINDFYDAKENFEDINYSDLTKAVEGYKQNLKIVKKCVDSVESDFVIKINNYKGMKKSAIKLIKKYDKINEKLMFEQNQLENLKYDIENELLIMDSINKFILIEDNNMIIILSDIRKASESYNFIMSTHKTLYPYVKDFAERYCRKNEI